MTQEIIVYMVLAMTVLYVSFRTLRKTKTGSRSSSCGDCCGCSISPGNKDNNCNQK